MTDAALANGSGMPGTPPPAAGADGKPIGAVDPFDGLETGTREWIGTKGYKSVSDVAKAAQNAESLIGRSIQLPGDDAKPEDVDKYISKATEKYRPKDANGYEFRLPDGVPKEMPYDGDGAKEFKSVAHEIGLTAKQAQKAHDWFVSRSAKAFTTTADGLVKTAGEQTDALVKDWGPKDSDGFKSKMDLATKFVRKNGGDELLKDLRAANLLGPGDIILSASLAKAFASAGSFDKEDALIEGSGGAAVDNPFAAGPDKGNLTEQNILWKQDPAKAERLMQAAGFTAQQFGFRRS